MTYPLLASFDEAFKEVIALLLHSQSRPHHVVGIPSDLHDGILTHSDHYLHKLAQSNISQCYRESAEPHASEDELDPGVVVDIFQALERLPKDEITHNIECGPIVPGLDVQWLLSLVTFLMQPLIHG